MDSGVVRLYKLRQHVDITVRVLIRKVLVDSILDRPVCPFHDGALDVRILAHLKLDALAFQHCI